MRKILLVDGDEVTPLNETKFTEEGKLQDYLEEYPTLIPLADIVEGASDLLCIGREVPAGPGWVDLLFIDKDGLLTIVETKLAKNPEARREVVGQVIEYASYISKWTADDVCGIADEYLKSEGVRPIYRDKTLYEAIKQSSLAGSFSIDGFRSNVEQNLKNGRMRLIVAVDELIEPLRAMVTFLNSYSNFDIFLLQVTDFEESKAKKVLVPVLFGYVNKPTGTGSKHWDEPSFRADLQERMKRDELKPEIADTTMGLLEFTKDNAEMSWGRGATYGSFSFRKSRYGTSVSIFTINSNGWGYICFGQLASVGVKEEVLQAFRAKLNEIPGINMPEEVIKFAKFPSIKVETLTKAESLKNFQGAVLTLCQQIES